MTDATRRFLADCDEFRRLFPPPPQRAIFIHPDNLRGLGLDVRVIGPGPIAPTNLSGLPVYTRESLPKFAKKKIWQIPFDPFIEYEPVDEEWARPLGIGQEMMVDDESRLVAFVFDVEAKPCRPSSPACSA